MHAKLGELVQAVTALIDALEPSPIPYAFGGAIALSAWSVPRATTDIDLNLWVAPAALGQALGILRTAGVDVADGRAVAEASARGLFVARILGYHLDVFVPSVPFYETALTRRRRVRLAGRETWVLSPECLAVFKLLFFRGKDLVDLETLLQVQGEQLDVGFVRREVAEMMGDQDQRIARWDALIGSLRRSSP